MGLEHHESSLNGIDEEALVKEDKKKGRAVYLLAHELVHAWCGKYRRPAGMYRADYHTPKKTSELWIYEGVKENTYFIRFQDKKLKRVWWGEKEKE